jgi:hypothetical protein
MQDAESPVQIRKVASDERRSAGSVSVVEIAPRAITQSPNFFAIACAQAAKDVLRVERVAVGDEQKLLGGG